ncbi:MAG: hypothetical protein WA183_08525, partial [Chthoniobacterales bacterium]
KSDTALEKSTGPAPIMDVATLEKHLEGAKRSAAGAERLFKIGALAKVEAEARVLKVVRLESDLENARLEQAKTQLLSQQDQKVSNGDAKSDVARPDVGLARAIEAAHAAATKRQQAELEAAEINLRRQQKLLALGSGHKSDVARAEQKLAELKAPKN